MNDEEFLQQATEIYVNNILQYEDTHHTALLCDVEATLHDGRIVRVQIKEAE